MYPAQLNDIFLNLNFRYPMMSKMAPRHDGGKNSKLPPPRYCYSVNATTDANHGDANFITEELTLGQIEF